MKKNKETKGYNWQYNSVGGVVRVKIDSGEAIAHLGELDQKKWTVLSCPVDGLAFDAKTLAILDSNHDGKIHVNEVVEAANWITSRIEDKDLLLQGASEIALSQIKDEALRNSAKQILANLGLEKDTISLADTSDSVAIFAKTLLNGDGIVTPASTTDAELSDTIAKAVATVGSLTDRSGAAGIDEALTGAFYGALADYSAWVKAGEADIYPFGANTEAALAACDAIKDKVADFFTRCKLLAFDESVAASVSVSASTIDAIGDCPIAKPCACGVLPVDAINPAWQGRFAAAAALVLPEDAKGVTEAEWNAILASFEPYKAWKASKKGAAVEGLGIETVNALLAANRQADILALIAEDKALEAESNSIDAVDKLLRLNRYFYQFLCNYVVLSDFYSVDKKADFEAGELYVDERCCKLCIQVANMGAHADMAGLSGMFLLYCTCTSKVLGKTLDIVAVMTDGTTQNLRPGKHAIFYDREGNDYDATITKIVDNPINIKQAFFAPYRKAWDFIVERINKSAAAKDNAVVADLKAGADSVDVKAGAEGAAAKASAFDIAKFAGIFAAIGMAVGFISQALVSLATGIAALSPLQFVLVVLGIMLVISGPSCFIAWSKLRKRNLGPVLNANGWAINSKLKINIPFGATLTSVAKYPLVKAGDPFSDKTPGWKIALRWFCVIVVLCAVAAFIYWKFFCDGDCC